MLNVSSRHFLKCGLGLVKCIDCDQCNHTLQTSQQWKYECGSGKRNQVEQASFSSSPPAPYHATPVDENRDKKHHRLPSVRRSMSHTTRTKHKNDTTRQVRLNHAATNEFPPPQPHSTTATTSLREHHHFAPSLIYEQLSVNMQTRKSERGQRKEQQTLNLPPRDPLGELLHLLPTPLPPPLPPPLPYPRGVSSSFSWGRSRSTPPFR